MGKRAILRAIGVLGSSAWLGLGATFLAGCAEGATGIPGGGSEGAAGAGGGIGGSGGIGGESGSGGTSGGGGASGGGGNGGAGGSAPTLTLCVLNEGGPADPCESPEQLDYGTVPGGAQRMRLFRIDNDSESEAIFESAAVADADFSVEAVRYVEDPPNDPSQWVRAPVTLPYPRAAGSSLYFEVTYSSPGVSGPLPAVDVTVKATVGGNAVPTIVVPIVGDGEACAAGTAVCDADPTNGCETDIHTSLDHCGACGKVCDIPHANSVCQGGVCSLASCDPGYGNCNGNAIDGCEEDTTTSLPNCGGCGNACNLANASEACVGSVCTLLACTLPYGNCNGMTADGCETNLDTSLSDCGGCGQVCDFANASETCNAGTCTLGACMPGFDNCDAMAGNGCETDLNTSLANCGACNMPCALANASESCNAGACTLGVCDPGFGNCDGGAANGCEINITSDASNCGGCNNNCAMLIPNANVACGMGSCQLVSCLPGYFDADGMSANGCECIPSGVDVPDDGFADTNCDGIDGDASAAIFVAKTGNDSNPGTRGQPMLTINAALSKALVQGKTQVYVSEGTYDGRISLFNGISIYGGYSAANNWARNATYVSKIQSSAVASGRVSAVEGTNITVATTLDRLTIQTLDAPAGGISNYALYCNSCAALIVRKSFITAGAGGVGTAGTAGTAGNAGGNGGTGGVGACDSSGVRTGGAGGTSTCGRTGGSGGNGGVQGINAGAAGATGTGGTAGGVGGAGGDPGKPGTNGTSGGAGAAGTNGAGGSGGATASGFWVGNAGAAGTLGVHGNGAGGGGGGGGQGGALVVDGGGNGGGGGGAGGCGGNGGTGGNAGGGSFGVFVVSSNGMQLVGNTITSSKGGNGGNGGNGGTGGNGGAAGAGATTCTAEVGAGGNGGAGGKGGNGGHGGGGAGGPSYSVYRVSSAGVSTAGNTMTFGGGGTGGTSAGNAGTAGSAGQVF